MDGWRQFLRSAANSQLPSAVTSDELTHSLKSVKLGTAPGYDNIHPEFLKNLGPIGCSWRTDLFTRIMHENRTATLWKQAKVIALEKPGKDAHLASSYCPISLLSVNYKLLERRAAARITSG